MPRTSSPASGDHGPFPWVLEKRFALQDHQQMRNIWGKVSWLMGHIANIKKAPVNSDSFPMCSFA